MREILFHGKRTDTKEWVEGFYVHFVDSWKNCETHRIYLKSAETDCGDYYPDWYAVDPETVGQFTGLRDRNGRRIFEGDIMRFYINIKTVLTGKIVFARGAFQFETTEDERERFSFDDPEIVMPSECCEVIGNIYDTPELLEVKQ